MDKKNLVLKVKIFFFMIIFGFVAFYCCHFAVMSSRLVKAGKSRGMAFIDAVTHMAESPFDLKGLNIAEALPPFFAIAFVAGFATLMIRAKRELYRQDRPGAESGSAGWNKDMKTYNATFVDEYTKEDKEAGLPENNVLYADGLKMSMNTRKTLRNLNAMIIGGSGAGKTFRFIKPNLAQMNCSYVITDPSGEILHAMGTALMDDGYRIRLFSTSDMKHSNAYNPMDYIYDDDGEVDQTKVGILVSTFIANAGENNKKGGGDPFWKKSSIAFMTFAVLFLAEFMPLEKRNMYQILRLAQSGKTDESSNSSQTMLDKIVMGAQRQNPKAKCFSSYYTFKLAPAKTANSILISMAVDLNPFSMDNVRNLTTTSYVCRRNRSGQIVEYIRDPDGKLIRDDTNLDLETIGDSKTALFVNIPQANGAYNFLISMMYSQLFETLYSRAERICPNRYHIFDRNGIAIASEFKSEEEAMRHLAVFQNAEIVEYKEKKTDEPRYFLYNKKAKEFTLPEFAVKKKYGYIQEVYSKEVGEKLLARYRPMKKANMLSDEEASEKKAKKSLIRITKKQPQGKKRTEPYIERGRQRLPIHVRFLLDEFSNIGEIPNFEKMLSTMRKYEISCTVILQSLAQIKAMYEKVWEVLIGNCDAFIFLGSSENDTCKYVSEKLGKQTIRTFDESQSKSNSGGSISTSFKKQARDLLDPAEVGKLDNSECIVIIRGLNPFKRKKLDFSKHPNFKKTGDYDKSRVFDDKYMERYFKCLNKEQVDTDVMMAEEEHQKETLAAQRNARGKKAGRPMRNRREMADAMGIKDPENKKELDRVKSPDPSDYAPDAGVMPQKAVTDTEISVKPKAQVDDSKPAETVNAESQNNDAKDTSSTANTAEKTSDSSSSAGSTAAFSGSTPTGPETGDENEWFFA